MCLCVVYFLFFHSKLIFHKAEGLLVGLNSLHTGGRDVLLSLGGIPGHPGSSWIGRRGFFNILSHDVCSIDDIQDLLWISCSSFISGDTLAISAATPAEMSQDAS